jgi:hypothetical protein
VEDLVHVRTGFLFWQVHCRVREIQRELIAGVKRPGASVLASAVLGCHRGPELAAPAHLIQRPGRDLRYVCVGFGAGHDYHHIPKYSARF